MAECLYVIVCPEAVSDRPTGLSKRSWQLARLLEIQGLKVCVIGSDEAIPPDAGVIFINVFDLGHRHYSFSASQRVVCDLYSPFFLENRAQNRMIQDHNLLTRALGRSDAYLCATQRQSDLYRGILLSQNGLPDPSRLLTLPFCLYPETGDAYLRPGRRFAWIGGFWQWFEPQPLLSCLDSFLKSHPQCHFSFIGVSHPRNPPLGFHEAAYSDLLKLHQKNPEQMKILPWLSPKDYRSALQDVDRAVILHQAGLEADYAIRTRYCELLEQKIPLVVSRDSYFSNYIEANGLGLIVEAGADIQSALSRACSHDFSSASYEPVYLAHDESKWADTLYAFTRMIQSAHDIRSTATPILSVARRVAAPFMKRLKNL